MEAVAERTRSNEYIKLVVRRMYDAQKLRIQSDLRMQRLVRDGLVIQEDAEKTFDKARKLEVDTEREYEKIVWREVKNLPIVEEWLGKVRGIGPRLSGLLVALIGDIGRFPYPSHLWAYCGLHVKNGKAVRREKGVKSNWSDELKTTCWKIAQQFIKQGGPYRDLYDTYKPYLVARELRNGSIIWGKGDKNGKWKPVHVPKGIATEAATFDGKLPEWTLGRINAMAARRTVKIFLSHLWEVWRNIEGLESNRAYVIDRLGHEGYIDPWEMIEKDEPDRA